MAILSPENVAILQKCLASGERCHIILDLDNTLISAIPYSSIEKHHRKLPLRSHNFGNDYIVFERPGVQKLLDYLFSKFIVSVWSAGSRDYVNFVVQRVISREGDRSRPRVPYIVLNHDHCVMSQQINSSTPKDLRFVWGNPRLQMRPDNTLIIDDLPAVYAAQPQNTIAIPAFDVEDPEQQFPDTALTQLMIEKLAVSS